MPGPLVRVPGDWGSNDAELKPPVYEQQTSQESDSDWDPEAELKRTSTVRFEEGSESESEDKTVSYCQFICLIVLHEKLYF